jgi:hypothetical protein
LAAAIPVAERAAATGSVQRALQAIQPAVDRFGAIAKSQEAFARQYGITACVQ